MNKKTLLPWIICLLGAAFYCYDFLLRVMPSIMIHPLMVKYGANAAQIGILSAFYYNAYTPLQLPAGIVVDKYNPKLVMTISALLCAVGTLIFATTDSLAIANVSRAMMGAGSAFAFVGTLKLASIWLPKNRFALFAGITSALGMLGAILADNILSYMVHDIGWQQTSYLCGLVGLALTIALFLIIKNKQNNCALNSASCLSWLNIFKQMLSLAKKRHIWINGIIGALLFMPISVFASLWGVDFLARRYVIDHTHAASAVSLVFIGAIIVFPIVGYLSDKTGNRRTPLWIGNIGCIISSLLLIYNNQINITQAYCLLFLVGCFTAPQILVFAVAKDLSSQLTTGIATAITNFLVTAGAVLFQPLVGYMLDCKWHGANTMLKTPFFTVAEYRYALSPLLLVLFVSLVLIFFLPKHSNFKSENL